MERLDPEAQVVDNYEPGLRATGMSGDASLALFESRSDQGTTFDPANNWQMTQQEERVFGLGADLSTSLAPGARAAR